MANPTHSTGYEPKEFDKITSVDDDTMLINGPNHNFSDFSKTTKGLASCVLCFGSVSVISLALWQVRRMVMASLSLVPAVTCRRNGRSSRGNWIRATR